MILSISLIIIERAFVKTEGRKLSVSEVDGETQVIKMQLVHSPSVALSLSLLVLPLRASVTSRGHCRPPLVVVVSQSLPTVAFDSG